jgi:hypothetical protein
MIEPNDDPPTGYIIVNGEPMAYWGPPIEVVIKPKAPVQIDPYDYVGFGEEE